MDAGKVRKRPWAPESWIESHTKRRNSSAVATLDQRKLPPLYTPACSTVAGPLTTGPIGLPFSVHQSSEFRSRSQSLFDSPQHALGEPWLRSIRESSPRALEWEPSPRPIGSGTYLSQFGTDHMPHEPAAGDLSCCSSGCQGQKCLSVRALLHELASEVALLDSRAALLLQRDHRSSVELHDPEEVSIKKILQWALKKVSETSLNLQYHIDHPASRSPEQNASQQNASQPDTTVNMRRGHTFPDLRDEHSPPTRPYMPSYHSFTSLTNSANAADPGRNNPYSSEMPPTTNSPHHTASSSGSVFMGPHSPLQAPQPTRPTMLPSPSSMHFSSVSTLAPISPPVPAATQAAAQSTFLQDLQHQISVKTIAHQSLQREYENLLQKLDRQRTKCATLEKKFEVSDVEINNLTDEKEMLLAQVAAMERQVEELQESRDESRRQLVANGAQYMRIMEMANRLQAQSAEDKKRWDAEKAELQQRIRVLEEAMVTGTDSDHPDRSPPPSIIFAYSSGSRASPSTETINVLRGEIGRLRIRTQTLEKALQTTKEEGMSIQEAAKTLMNSGGKIEQATRGALE